MLVGKRISDRYKIEKLIGGGGMSNVYLAHDMILNRDVAIKILRYDFTNEEELHRRFQREALSATSLTHPSIVSIYDVGEDGDTHYIVMEYIKGKTLKQYIQEFSPLAPARAVHIMKQLTGAMAHAHEHGIIHRDIKPQNILMDEQGNVKITDFGIATTLSATSYTQTNSVIGTVHYLSPEQARGGSASKKSDVYALGIVLYELLTGQLPFSGESAVSIALKHLQTETPSVRAFDATIPQSVENIILKATAKDANHRYDSMEDMEADLATSLSASRLNEPKFTLPVDDEATKVMPIIKEPAKLIAPVEKPVEKQEPVPAPLKKPAKKKWPILLGMLAVLAILAIVAMNLLTPNKVDVPDVKNLPVQEAITQLQAAGFVVGEQEELNSEEIAAGNIINTEPKAGVERVKKTEIKLLVSIGRETVTLDDYTGKQVEQIATMLANRFAHIEKTEVYSDEPAGQIIKQEPEAGSEIVESDTTLRFEVSKGKELVTVASLKSFTAEQRHDYERTSGLRVSVSSEVYSASIPVGSVVTQKPAAGADVEPGTLISVTISKGPEPEPEPEPEPAHVKFSVRKVEIPYEPLEEGMEQHVVIYIQDKTHSMADVYKEMTIVESEIVQLQFEIEEGSKAAYQIVRDNNVIASDTILYEDLE
ncbi:MAG: Stk1 family PASTA domain-containing Ser/Thr kinase [Solibacillus sp.]